MVYGPMVVEPSEEDFQVLTHFAKGNTKGNGKSNPAREVRIPVCFY